MYWDMMVSEVSVGMFVYIDLALQVKRSALGGKWSLHIISLRANESLR